VMEKSQWIGWIASILAAAKSHTVPLPITGEGSRACCRMFMSNAIMMGSPIFADRRSRFHVIFVTGATDSILLLFRLKYDG